MTKLTTIKRKANVGERIHIVAAKYAGGQYMNGSVAEVISACEVFPETLVYVKEWQRPVHIDEYRVFVEADTSNARLSEAEAKIAALEAEVKALKVASKPTVYRGMSLPKEIAKTPNSRRADVIKRAQAFVADLEKRSGYAPSNTDGNHLFNEGCSELDFHVNAEKRTVVALAKNHIKYHGNSRVRTKAIAKCHPNDVFNADIGKAIAAGKLYGVDIPQEFVDAPKPTEPVVGMAVKGNEETGYYRNNRTFTLTKPRHGGWAYSEEHGHSAKDWIEKRSIGDIIEDTDADYS